MSTYILPILRDIATNRRPPTVTARLLFLAGAVMMLTSCSIGSIPFQVDSTSSLLGLDCPHQEAARYALFTNVVTPTLQTVFPSASLPSVIPIFGYNDTITALQNQASAFLASRASDGSSASMPVPNPNGSRTIVPGTPLGTPLPEPLKWTPLHVNGQTQSFLTPQWGYVQGVVDQTDFLSIADTLFPTPEQREKEVDEITSLTYTNEERMIAEVWAGGPGTVTPPGIWALLACKTMEHLKYSWSRQVCVHFLLCASLFQASITAWRVKRTYMQQRPIQAIMQRPAHPMSNWNGSISSDVWVPYQETNFVTPPFPDYISGHSTFSGAAAAILSEVLGDVQPTDIDTTFTQQELNLISPIFARSALYSKAVCTPACLFFAPAISNIDAAYPYTTIATDYGTWRQMAQECGKSRIYGGIHTQSANAAGLLIGDSIGKAILRAYPLFTTG